MIGVAALKGRERRWAWLRGLLVAAAGLLLAAIAFLPPVLVIAGVLGLLAIGVTLRAPWTGFVLLALSVPWSTAVPGPLGSAPFTTTDMLAGLLAAVWLTVCVAKERNPLERAHWTPFLAIFLAVIALSYTQAQDTHAAQREIVKWAEVGVVYLAGVSLIRTRREVELVVAGVVAAGVTQALYGFAQVGLYLGPAAFARAGGLLRAFGTFDQPNPYAGYLNIVFAIALGIAIMRGGRARRWYGGAGAVLFAAVVVSESRGALLAGLAAAVVMFCCRWAAARQLTLLGLLAGVCFGFLTSFSLVPSGPLDRVLSAVGLGGVSFGNVTDANFSAVERAAHWLAGVRMFAAHPLLGVGIGNYGAAYPAYHPRGWYASLEHAHNYYINIAAEAGIVGLTAYALLAGSALWYSYAAMRRAGDRVYSSVGLGALGALVATDIHNVFDVLYVHGIAALLGLVVALASVALRDGRALPSPTPETH